MNRIAAIDIGTNTILMVIAEYDENSGMKVLHDEHAIARLGKGVDAQHRILPETVQRVEKVLDKYRSIAHSFDIATIVACGTSALRDATNRYEFIEYIHQKLGIRISVLSGTDEAQLTFLGALVGWWNEDLPVGVLDIGGGSTELSIGKGLILKKSSSIDVGSVRLTERILKSSPPTDTEIQTASQFIKEHIHQFPPLESNTALVGVAGTVTTLAAIDLGLVDFRAEKIHTHKLSIEAIRKVFDTLKQLNVSQLKTIPAIHPDRADIIVAGTLILLTIMEALSIEHITVSTQGLRYGIAYNALNKV